MADNISVAIRVRPLINREENDNAAVSWKTESETIVQVDSEGKNKSNPYKFDRVFDINDTTQDVYEEIAQPIVKAAMEGYDGTIFAYGQTSSGKTFTMHGNRMNKGVIPLAIDEIFATIADSVHEREFLLRAYYVELYNEGLKDLLIKDKEADKELKIRETIQKLNGESKIRVSLTNMKEPVCTKAEDVLDLIKQGEERRHVGSTNMNEHSSRSHTIFCIIIESRMRSERRESGDGCVQVSHLYLVDLAGSEKADETKATGERLKEACNINLSLFTLSQVIQKLSRGEGHIPFRNSKLTRLLQSSLGGNSKTAIICNVTPAAIEQTHSTLQFATRAKTIQNTATVNEILSDEAMMQRYKKELQQLKKKIEKYEKGGLTKERDELFGRLEQSESEKSDLVRAYEEKMKNLSSMLLVSNTSSQEVVVAKKRKLRRETWCPGSRKIGTPLTKALANANVDFPLSTKPPLPMQPLKMLPMQPLNASNHSDDSGSTSSGGASVSSQGDKEQQPSPSDAVEMEKLSDSVFNFQLPDYPSDSSSGSDREERRNQRKRRRTVRFADEDIPEEPSEPQQDERSQLEETMSMCEKLIDEKQSLELQLEEKGEEYRQLQYEMDIMKVDVEMKEMGDDNAKEDNKDDTLTLIKKQMQEKQRLIDNLELDVNKYRTELEELREFTKQEANTIQEAEDEFKAEIAALKKSLEERDASVGQFQQMQQMNFEEKSLADAEFMLMDLRKKLSEITTQNRNLEQEMEKMKVTIKKLNEEKSDFDSHLHFEKERSQKMITDLKEQLQRAYDENVSLYSSCSTTSSTTDTQKTTETSKEMEVLRTELEEMKKTLEELNSKNSQMGADLADSIDSSIEAQQQVMDAQEELEQTRGQIGALQAQLANSDSTGNGVELAALQDQIENLQQELHMVKTQQSQAHNSSIIKNLKDELEAAAMERSFMESSEDRIKQLENVITEQNHSLANLEQELQFADLEKSCQESPRGRIKQLEAIVAEKEQALDELKQELQDMKLYSDELEGRVKDLEDNLLEKDHTIDDLTHELDTADMVKSYSAELEGRVKELEKEVLDWSDKCVQVEDEMQCKVSYLEKQVAQQRHSVSNESAISTQEMTSQEVDILTELNAELEKQVADLQEELKLAQNNADSLMKESVKQGSVEGAISDEIINGKIEEAQSQVKELEAKLTALTDELVEAQSYKVKADDMCKQVEELTDRLDATQSNSESADLENKLVYLEKQLEEAGSYKSIAEQLEQKVEELRQNQTSDDVDALRGTLQQTESQLQDKIGEVNHLKTHMNELTEELELASQDRNIKDLLQLQVGELQRSLEQAQHESKELRGKVGVLTKVLEEAQEIEVENGSLRSQVDKLKQQLSENRKTVEEFAGKNGELTKHIHSMKRQSVDDTDWLEMQVTTLETQLKDANKYQSIADDLKTRVIDLETRLAEAEEHRVRAEQLEQRVVELTEKTSCSEPTTDGESFLKEQLEDLEKQLIEARSYQQEAEELRQQVETLSRQIEESEAKHEEEIAEIKAIKESSPQEVEALKTHIEEMDEQIIQGKAYVAQLMTNVEDSRQVCQERDNRITELEQQIAHINSGSSEVEALQNKVEKLTEELQTSETEHKNRTTDLEQQIADLSSKSSEVEELQKKVEKLTEELQTSETKQKKRIKELEQQIVDLYSGSSEVDALQKKIAKLTEELQGSETEHKKVLDELDLAREDLQEMDTLQEHAANMERQITEGRAYVSELMEDLKEAKQTNEDSEAYISEMKQQLEENEIYINEIKQQLEENKADQTRLMEELQTVTQTCEDKEQQVSELEQQLEENVRDQFKYKEEIVTARQSIEENIEELSSLMQQRNTATSRCEQLSEELAAAHSSCADKENQVVELERQLTAIRANEANVLEELDSVKQASQEAALLHSQVVTLQQQQNTATAMCDQLSEELAAAHSSCADKENQVVELEKQLTAVGTNEACVLEELNSYKQASQEAALLHGQVASLQKKLVETEELLSVAQQASQEAALLHSQVAVLEKKLVETEELLSVAQQKCVDKDWLEVEVGELKKQLDGASSAQGELEEARSMMERRAEELSQELQIAGQEQERMKQEVQASVAELKEKHKAELEKEQNAREKEEAFLKKCCDEADEELETEKIQLVEALKRIQELETHQLALQDSANRCTILQQQVNELQQHLQEKSRAEVQTPSRSRHNSTPSRSRHNSQSKVSGMASQYEAMINISSNGTNSYTTQLEGKVSELTKDLEAAIKSNNDANCSERQRLAVLECRLEEAKNYTEQMERSYQQLEQKHKALLHQTQKEERRRKSQPASHDTDLAQCLRQTQQELEDTKTAIAELKEKHKAGLSAQYDDLYEKRQKEEQFLKKCIEEADDELADETQKCKTLEAEVGQLKKQHKAELDGLTSAREKEETFLKKCISEADEELEATKGRLRETVKKVKELESQIATLKALPEKPTDIKALEKQVKELDLTKVHLEYELRRTKEELDKAKYHIEDDAQKFKTHIKKLMADNDKLKKANTATTDKPNTSATPAQPVAASSSASSSGVILECELFSEKHKNKELSKTNTKLERDNKDKAMRCMLLEQERNTLQREMNHFKKQAKIYYYKYKNVTESGKVDVELEEQARALQDVNETPGLERSPARRHPDQPANNPSTTSGPSSSLAPSGSKRRLEPDWTSGIIGREEANKKPKSEWPQCTTSPEEEEDNAAECKQS